MSVLDRFREQEARALGAVGAFDAELAKTHPGLSEFLTAVEYPNGKGPRETSTLLVFTEAGRWKGCLGDRDTNKSLWATADSFGGILASLEAMLTGGTGEWRDKPARKGR